MKPIIKFNADECLAIFEAHTKAFATKRDYVVWKARNGLQYGDIEDWEKLIRENQDAVLLARIDGKTGGIFIYSD